MNVGIQYKQHNITYSRTRNKCSLIYFIYFAEASTKQIINEKHHKEIVTN